MECMAVACMQMQQEDLESGQTVHSMSHAPTMSDSVPVQGGYIHPGNLSLPYHSTQFAQGLDSRRRQPQKAPATQVAPQGLASTLTMADGKAFLDWVGWPNRALQQSYYDSSHQTPVPASHSASASALWRIELLKGAEATTLLPSTLVASGGHVAGYSGSAVEAASAPLLTTYPYWFQAYPPPPAAAAQVWSLFPLLPCHPTLHRSLLKNPF